jgi:cysteine desulfurase/selenocysteine lyase
MTNARQKVLPFPVESVRLDFPILQQDHHPGTPLIYLDNAATSQKPRQVIEAMDDYYRRYNANVHRGIHKLSEQATTAYEEARIKIRKFINATSKREIIFTRGTTESINLVAQTWGRTYLKKGDVVILTAMEHHSNIVPWQILAAEKEFVISYVPVLSDGALDMDTFDELLHNKPVKFVSVMHVSNVLGTINPVEEIAHKAHTNGAKVLIDAAQSVPHMPIDVQAMNVDFLTFSGHKMVGPTGAGVLYGKREVLNTLPPWMGGGDMIASVGLEGSTWNDLPHKFEAGTPAIAEVIGLGHAVDYLTRLGMDSIHAYEQTITTYALERLSEMLDLKVYGPVITPKGAVAAFTYANIHPHDLAQILDTYGIAIRAGHHCAMPLHESLKLNATARASFYFYNTLNEVDSFVEALYQARKVFST